MKKNIVTLMILLCLIPATSATAQATVTPQEPTWPTTLVPMGQTAGVQFTSQGLTVVGYSEIPEVTGSPAQESGLLVGDFITHLDGKQIESAIQFQADIQAKEGHAATLRITRGGNTTEVTLTPKHSPQESQYKIGAWVRDSISGIGTLTFYDPQSGVFGALGHGINDNNTKLLLPIASGSLLCTQVVDVRRGQAGQPGELKGVFAQESVPGSLLLNTTNGLFGILDQPEQFGLHPSLPTAKQSEVTVGKATMLSNVEGSEVQEFEIEIMRVFQDNKQESTRNYMIRVTDETLIEKTGGIVQGMSGSPILQNGKFVGAVTHVLVSDPKRGYGIFIDNMLSEIYSNAPTISLAPPHAA